MQLKIDYAYSNLFNFKSQKKFELIYSNTKLMYI